MNWIPVDNPSSTDPKLWLTNEIKGEKTRATLQVNMVSTKTIQIQQQQQQHVDRAFHWAPLPHIVAHLIFGQRRKPMSPA